MFPSGPYDTERLQLRPYGDQDVEVVHAALDLDREIWRFDPGFERSLEDRRGVIARFAMLHKQFGFGPCGAFRKEDGRFIGQAGLNPYIYEHRDRSRTVEFEVMYKVARPFWRQGYACEMARFWVDFAFSKIRLPRLCTAAARANVGSVAVLRKLGCRIEDDWLEPETVIGILNSPKTTVT